MNFLRKLIIFVLFFAVTLSASQYGKDFSSLQKILTNKSNFTYTPIASSKNANEQYNRIIVSRSVTSEKDVARIINKRITSLLKDADLSSLGSIITKSNIIIQAGTTNHKFTTDYLTKSLKSNHHKKLISNLLNNSKLNPNLYRISIWNDRNEVIGTDAIILSLKENSPHVGYAVFIIQMEYMQS